MIQPPSLFLSACILVSVHTWSNDDISTYRVTQKGDGSPGTLVVRTRTDDDHHLLIMELRPGAGEPEQEAGAQATAGTGSEAAERRVISIHPHRWITSDATGAHYHYRSDFPTSDLTVPDDIHFIFDQWLSSPYFGSKSHGELATMSHLGPIRSKHMYDVTRFPHFRLGVLPSLSVLNRLASSATAQATVQTNDLLLPIPPIAIPTPSRTGSATMEVFPHIMNPVVETRDGSEFTVRGRMTWDYRSFRQQNRGTNNSGLLDRFSAFLNNLVRPVQLPVTDASDQLPVTAHFTYHPENDRVQLDNLEIGEYLTITHTSSGETDSQDEFVKRLWHRWEEYLKQEGRLNFEGEGYFEFIRRKHASDPDAAIDLLKPHGVEHESYVTYKMYRFEQDSPSSHLQTEAEQPLTEASQDALPASNENGAVGTNNTTPLASDPSPLTGEPLSRSTILLNPFNKEL